MAQVFDPNGLANVPTHQAVQGYVDDRLDQCLDFKQVHLDAKEITLSFDYPTTESLLDKMNKKTLEVLLEHLNELQLHVEKRIFEKS